jgi:uncharacterized membrane protein
MSGAFYATTLATAIGCVLVAGVFFAFSTFVMDALADLPSAEGIGAMQSINRAAINPLFMGALFGTAVACLGLGVWAAISWGERPAAWVIAGCALYIVGTIVVTIAANVPLNDQLANLDAQGVDAASRWTSYVADWTAWNHVRGAAALGAAVLLAVAVAVR